MQVDYLLYHEDRSKIEGMLECLTACDDGLFLPRMRARWHVATSGNGPRWSGVICRDLLRVGANVLRYNVTLPSTYPYPELVAALLIDKGWQVKVRYRNADADDPWTYMKCDFPEGTEYALPAGWQE
jgi:hypothetical protein